MDIRLIWHLLAHAFSLNRRNMRAIKPYRLLVALTVFPLFVALLITNRIFLTLDLVFQRGFLRTDIESPVFIVSLPRTGTTYLYHTLANDPSFTCFRLWEIVFAPSVIQKKLIIAIRRIDRQIGDPFKKSFLMLDNLLADRIKNIHLTGLNLPDEDEAVLLWDLSSLYIQFAYPDSEFFEDYMLFDSRLALSRRRSIMASYKRYVQRHMYVYAPKGAKRFLSKNPLMMCKLESMADTFPDAIILTIERSLKYVVPSTIALNKQLYSLFTSVPPSAYVNHRTRQILVSWYKMGTAALNERFVAKHLKIDFDLLMAGDPLTTRQIAKCLQIDDRIFPSGEKRMSAKQRHKSRHSYKPLSGMEQEQLNADLMDTTKYS